MSGQHEGFNSQTQQQQYSVAPSEAYNPHNQQHGYGHIQVHHQGQAPVAENTQITMAQQPMQSLHIQQQPNQPYPQQQAPQHFSQQQPPQMHPQQQPPQPHMQQQPPQPHTQQQPPQTHMQQQPPQPHPQQQPPQSYPQQQPPQPHMQQIQLHPQLHPPHSQPPQSVNHPQSSQTLRPHLQDPSHSNSHPSSPQHVQPPIPQQFPMDQQTIPGYPMVTGPQNIPSGYPAHALPGNVGTMRFPNSANTPLQYQQHPNMDPRMTMESRMPAEPRMPNMEPRMPTMEPRMPSIEPRMSLEPRMPMQQMMPRPQLMLMPPNKNSIGGHPQFIKQDTKTDEPSDTNDSPIQCHPHPSERQFYSQNEQIPQQQDFHQQYQPQYNYIQQQTDSNNAQVPYNPNFSSNQPPHIPTSGPPSSQQDPSMCQQIPSQQVQNVMPPFQQNTFPGMENSNRMPHPPHSYPNQLPMDHPSQLPPEQQNKQQEHMMGHQQGYPYQPPHINGENIQGPPHDQMRFIRPPGPFGQMRPPMFPNGQTRMGPPFHPPMPRQPGMAGQENFVARLPQQMPMPPQAQMAHPPQQPMQPPMMPSQMMPEQSAMPGQYNIQTSMLIHKHPLQQPQHPQNSLQPPPPPVSQQSENSESPQPQETLMAQHPQQLLQPRHPQMMIGPQRPMNPHMMTRMPLQPGMIAYRNPIPMDPRFQNPQGFPIRPQSDMNRGSPHQLNRMPHPRMQHIQMDPQLETHHSAPTSGMPTKEAKENMQMVPKGTIITTCSSPAMMNPTSIMIPPNAMAQHLMKADPSLQGPGAPVPWGWKRLVLQDRVVYFSPSGIELKTHEDIKEYLSTEGTCKCGLECPLLVDNFFDFNPQKPSALWMPSPMVLGSNSSQCCQHKNSILTKAQLQSTPGLGFRLKHFHNPIFNNTQDGKKKVKKKKKPFSNVLVSQMLAAREAEKVRINEIIAQQKQQHEAKLQPGPPSTSESPLMTSLPSASASQATESSSQSLSSGSSSAQLQQMAGPSGLHVMSGPKSIAPASTKVHSGTVTSSLYQRAPQPIQAIAKMQGAAKTTSSQIQNHPRRPSTEIINPFVVSSTKPVQLALSNGKLMEVEPTSKSHSSSSQTAIANLGTNVKGIQQNNSSGKDEKSSTETQANISKAVTDDQSEINKTPCDMEDSDYKNTVSGHVAGNPTNAILANLPNDQSTKGKGGETNANELGKEQHSDVAKNIEIRRLSATEEGNKVLEPTFNSPEKDKKKNPLGNILDIVSGIEMPPAFKMLDENESRMLGRSRNSSPALSGSSSPGLAGIRPQLKGRKNRQYSSLPPLPHSPPPWVLGGPSLAHGQNMPPLISVDQIRGLRPPLQGQSPVLHSPQGGLIQGSLPGSNSPHLLSSSTPQMMVMTASGLTTSAQQMMVMSNPTTSSPPMMVMSGPTTSTPQMMVMSGPTMTTSAPQMMVMSGSSMTTSAPQMMVMSGPTMQVAGSQQNMQPLMQLVQTINGPMLMPMGSQPIAMDNNTVILQQQHPTPNFIQQQSPQITPTPSPVTLSLSPGSAATQLSPGQKKKTRKRKAPTQSPSTPSPIAPSPSTVPILMSPNGNIMSLQPIQGSQSSPTGGQVLTISQGSPGSNLITTGPSQTVQQLMPQNILLNQAGSQMILSNGTLMTVPQPQGIMYQQLPDGTLIQVQNTQPMPIIQQGGQQIFAQGSLPGTLPGQLVLQGNQLIMTQGGIVQAQGQLQGDMVTINAQRQIVPSPQSTTIVTKPKENSRKTRPKKKKKEEQAKTAPEPANYERERVNSPEQDSTDENDGSFEEPKPSTSKENSPKSNIQSNKVDSSGLNATPPHLRDFETLRSKSPFGSDLVTSFNDPDRSMDVSRGSNSSGNTTPRSNISLIDEKEDISEDEESNGEDEDDDEEDDDEEEEEDVEEDEEEGEGENRSPKLVTSSINKKKKRSADDFLQEQNLLFDEDTHQDSPAPPPETRDLKIGDLVWGPVNGFPSWPGKLVRDEGLGITRSKDKDLAWVCWFGNRQVSQVEVHRLKTLTEGLEAHHRERKKLRKGRKMNSSLEKAIQEAMLELD